MTTPIVIGRFRADSNRNQLNEQPRFTPAVGIDELFDSLYRKLPIDKIYFVDILPTEDGYVQKITEAGDLILNFLPTGEKPAPPVPVAPPTRTPPVAVEGPLGDESSKPIPQATPSTDNANLTPPRPSSEVYKMKTELPKGSLPAFPKPKSQSELLKERGLEQGSTKIEQPNKLGRLEKAQLNPTKSGKLTDKSKGKSKKKTIESDNLPDTVSRSSIEVTAIIPGSPDPAFRIGKIRN